MAITNNPAVASRLAAAVAREHLPREADVLRRLQLGRVQRIAIRPSVFSASLFPVMWAASWINASPDVYLWEKIRPLDPLPVNYCERYSNVQAAIGLEGLAHLDEWTEATIQHARELNDALADTGIETPAVPPSAARLLPVRDLRAAARRCRAWMPASGHRCRKPACRCVHPAPDLREWLTHRLRVQSGPPRPSSSPSTPR